MAAWYIFSALGFYPFCPGHPSYVLGSPLFKKATVHLADGKELVIEAPDNSADNVYFQRVDIDGTSHAAADVDHATLAAGYRLHFALGEKSESGTPAVMPFSLSTQSDNS